MIRGILFDFDGTLSNRVDSAYFMRNIPNALIVSVNELNVYDIVNADKLVFTETAAQKAGEVLA